jgi:hypothetical protein
MHAFNPGVNILSSSRTTRPVERIFIHRLCGSL